MNIEEFRLYCLSKKGVTEEFPFGPDTLVFKVMGKMFALTGLDEVEFKVNLKADPEDCIELRSHHPGAILPGYHMSKKHWNTVHFNELDDQLLLGLVDNSYDLVVKSLTKKRILELNSL